jgi:transcriptional regulator with XRE-family HTH domain
MRIGNKIRFLRKKFNLKQIDLANSLGITPQAVSKWEKDENFPDIYLLKKLACLFNTSLDNLLGMHEPQRDLFEATVFCSSINQFAQKGRRLSVRELAQWINSIFHYMTEIVLTEDGVPVKYTGDGFLCFFSGIRHAQRAFEVACEINRVYKDQGIVIFLNSGEIYFGLVGHNDYATKDICGDTVNQAFILMTAFSKKVREGIGITGTVKNQLETATTQASLNRLELADANSAATIYYKSSPDS